MNRDGREKRMYNGIVVGSSPPPTGGRDNASFPPRPSSPHRSLLTDTSDVGDIVMLGHGLLSRQVVVTLVQTQVLRCLLNRLGTLDHDRVEGSGQELVSCTFAPATTTASGPPAASTRRLRFTPFLPLSVALRPTRSPKACLAHSRVRRMTRPTSGRHAKAPSGFWSPPNEELTRTPMMASK